MTNKLKPGQEAFEIVDGPDAGKKFEPGIPYDRVPTGYEDHFEEVKKTESKKAKSASVKQFAGNDKTDTARDTGKSEEKE